MPEHVMTYAEQKRRNDRAMKERMDKMEEQQRVQQLEAQRRQKVRLPSLSLTPPPPLSPSALPLF